MSNPENSALPPDRDGRGRFPVLLRKRRAFWLAAALGIGAAACYSVNAWRRPCRGKSDLVVVQLTDLHLSTRPGGPTRTPWFCKISVDGYKLHRKCLGNSIRLFRRAVRVINEQIHPDLVVITGDIVDRPGDAGAWEQAGRILHQIRAPLLVVQGDHDAGAGPKMFEKYCGPLYRSTVVHGIPFFVLPYNADRATLARFARDFSRAPSATGLAVVCIHRMLKAPWLMRTLSKKFYGSVLLSPHQQQLVRLLHAARGRVLVLCGHSHTDYVKQDGNILHVCTSALVEYPHEIRVLCIRGNQVHSRLLRIDRSRFPAFSRSNRKAAPGE